LTPVLFSRNPENYTGYQGFTCKGLESEGLRPGRNGFDLAVKALARSVIILIESMTN
jgi:hypothetical protein